MSRLNLRWLHAAGVSRRPRRVGNCCPGRSETSRFAAAGFGLAVAGFAAPSTSPAETEPPTGTTRSLARAGKFEGRCGCLIATATNLFGPYGPRYEALPYAGHNMFFRDERGRWWSTFFGSDGRAPWRERPGIFPIEFDADGRVRAAQP